MSGGRRLALAAASLLLVSCLLPWYTFVGDLPSIPFRAFDGSGILAFIAALMTLALVALPYASEERLDGLDRPIIFALVTGLAVLGVLLWPVAFLDHLRGLLPDRAPGYWVAIVTTVLLGRAAIEVAREPAPPGA